MTLTRSQTGVNHSKAQRGYILLTLLLAVSLLAFAAAVVAPSIAFQIRRDREEEMIHRGAQYSRAVRLYAKKTGRFPLTLQDLYQQGNMRYIRKLYKDPISGGDFRLLHTSDIMAVTAPPNLNNSPSQPGDNQNAASSESAARFSNLQNADSQNTGSQNSSFQNSGFQDSGSFSSGGNGFGTQSGTAGSNGNSNSNASDPAGIPDDPTKGIFFGVASTSKEKTIREFDHKNHYDQWLFFYDINHDRGFLITGPTSLSLTNNAPLVGQPVAAAAQGLNAMPQSSTPQQSGAAQTAQQ
jgi:type II secretory pathway pseudopilin PulG